MKAMFMEKNDLNTSAGFIIEVRDFPRWSIRLLNHDPVIKNTNDFFWHRIYRVGKNFLEKMGENLGKLYRRDVQTSG